MKRPILKVENLTVGFHTYRGVVQAVNNVSFQLAEGEILGLVGESGCGKSVTASAIMGLLPVENSFLAQGKIELAGIELTCLDAKAMEGIRGREIAMIFQDPMTSLNPVLKIGTQLREGLQKHFNLDAQAAKKKSVELLAKLGIANPEKSLTSYPHQFSGGMRQRVVIAMALLCNPKVLIADEPTTALDVTIQAQILDLLKEIRRDFKTSIIFISHDLGIIAEMCDRVGVMYAGSLVEEAEVGDIFHKPLHPYTKGLLASLPRLADTKDKALHVIEGQPPDLLKIAPVCSFLPRCKYAMQGCLTVPPVKKQLTPTHSICCHLWRKQEVGCHE